MELGRGRDDAIEDGALHTGYPTQAVVGSLPEPGGGGRGTAPPAHDIRWSATGEGKRQRVFPGGRNESWKETME